jgi:hypothetical protein
LVRACRANNLPAISAIVVNDKGYPGSQYYPVAYPGIEDTEIRTIRIQQEIDEVAACVYPPLSQAGEIPAASKNLS